MAETNVPLCLQDLEKRYCPVDSFPSKPLPEHGWDTFEMTALKAKTHGHVLPDHNCSNIQVLSQRPESRERSWQQSFQDCGIKIFERQPSRLRIVSDQNPAHFEFVYRVMHGSERTSIITEAQRKFIVNFKSLRLLETEKSNNYALLAFHPE
jgi:hypothetical protein